MNLINKILDLLFNENDIPDDVARLIKKVKPFTMLNDQRLYNLYKLASTLNEVNLKGDFVECGSCRGGSGAILAYLALKSNWKRNVWLLDSFQGHPKPSKKSGVDKEMMKEWAGTMVASEADVIMALKVVGAFNKTKTKIVKGWFQKSLPKCEIKSLALVHIDADWYDSTFYCLSFLFPKITQGGFLIIDDYESKDFPGVKQAVDEYFKNQKSLIDEEFVVKPALVIRKA